MQHTHSEKIALISGGAQGIGKGIAAHFVALGMPVAILDIDAEAGRETEAELSATGPVCFVEGDVGDEAAVKQAVATVLDRYGKLDVLINNAGIGTPTNAPVEKLALADWERVIRTNLTGYFLLSKYAVPHLRQQQGAIINIASTRAVQSEPHTEAYATSKGGVVALTHALAASLGPDIRVNCISPGWIEVGDWQKSSHRRQPQHRDVDHAQHFVGRIGQPQDIAALAAFLVSEQAGFISGQNFIADGGMTRKMIYEP